MTAFIDLSGQKFGGLTVIKRMGTVNNKSKSLCVCECGKYISVRNQLLKNGGTKSCGCLRKENISRRSVKDLTDYRFGRLLVIKDSGKRYGKKVLWECLCNCGNIKLVLSYDLTKGKTKSCGCYSKELLHTTGTNHRNWNLDLTNEERIINRDFLAYKVWRKSVYERDNYLCRICKNSNNNKLNAHHINNYADFPKLRTELSNGITLCINCHKSFHKLFGQKKNTTDQFMEFQLLYLL